MTHSEFDRLRAATQRRLYSYLRRRMQAEDAEDLAAAVYVRAWERMAQYRPGYPFEAWLLRIARNMMIDAARKARVRPPSLRLSDLHMEYTAAQDSDPVACVESAQLSERMQRALDSLTPMRRRAVEMVYLAGLSCDEAADREGVCAVTLRTRLVRARAAMRRSCNER